MSIGTPTTPPVKARAQHLHVSPNKVRQVLSLIRGLSAEDATRVLQLCEKDAAHDVLKVLDAAVANAENNRSLPVDELYVWRAFADEGPTRKWGQPRARGRYFRVRHRSSHLTIELARYSDDELEERRRREEASSARGVGRGAQRRRAERVRRSRAAQRAEAHDHEHEHDHEVAEEVAPEVGPAGAEEIEATLERDEELEAADEEVGEAADEASDDDTDDDTDDEESK